MNAMNIGRALAANMNIARVPPFVWHWHALTCDYKMKLICNLLLW